MKNELEKYVVSIDSLLRDAIESIKNNKSRCTIVIDKHKKVIGVISEGDVISAILKGRNIYSPIKNSININFKFLKKKNKKEGLKIVKEFVITLNPIVDKNFVLKSILSIHDLLPDWNE